MAIGTGTPVALENTQHTHMATAKFNRSVPLSAEDQRVGTATTFQAGVPSEVDAREGSLKNITRSINKLHSLNDRNWSQKDQDSNKMSYPKNFPHYYNSKTNSLYNEGIARR